MLRALTAEPNKECIACGAGDDCLIPLYSAPHETAQPVAYVYVECLSPREETQTAGDTGDLDEALETLGRRGADADADKALALSQKRQDKT